ncbi:LysR substrate-binding domain-containing protein [Sporolactobacillus kofuensis]|nr:LysR substrate-binding domain-containing protein [Sporolactobacillus kofuensis]
MFFEHQLTPEHVSEFASVEAIKQCVLAGLGIALLPEMTVQNELKSGLLRVLPWGGDPLYIHSQLVWLKDKWVSPALSVFLSMTQAYLKEL